VVLIGALSVPDCRSVAVVPVVKAPVPMIDPDQQTWLVRVRFVVRKRLGVQEIGDALTARWRIHGRQAGGERPGGSLSAQGEHLRALEQGFDGPAQPRPKLDLAGDGARDRFAGQARIQHQAIRELHRLTHDLKVAKCYPVSIPAVS